MIQGFFLLSKIFNAHNNASIVPIKKKIKTKVAQKSYESYKK